MRAGRFLVAGLLVIDLLAPGLGQASPRRRPAPDPGVSLSCLSPDPSTLAVKVVNRANRLVSVDFDVSAALSDGTVHDRARRRIVRGASEQAFTFELPHGSFGETPPTLRSCAISRIRVCRATPHRVRRGRRTYVAFTADRCTALRAIAPVSLLRRAPPRPPCVAVRLLPTLTPQGSDAMVYGWAAAGDAAQAVDQARTAAVRAGERFNDGKPQSDVGAPLEQYYSYQSCEKPHGALVAQLRGDDDSLARQYDVAFGDDEGGAQEQAMAACTQRTSAQPHPDRCVIAKTW